MRAQSVVISPEEQELEEALQADMTERGRRLSAFKELTAGKLLVEVEPGEWRYVSPEDAAQKRRRRQSERRGPWGSGSDL